MNDLRRTELLEHRHQLQAAARERAESVVGEMVTAFGGQTVTRVLTRLVARPGVNTVEPEPIACLEAARELERAAHDGQLRYIRLARETGRSWYEIGRAMDLFWESVVSKESIADEAYDRALRLQNPNQVRDREFRWSCTACRQVVNDRGPWPALPEQEAGHADGCERWNDQVAAWRQNPDR